MGEPVEIMSFGFMYGIPDTSWDVLDARSVTLPDHSFGDTGLVPELAKKIVTSDAGLSLEMKAILWVEEGTTRIAVGCAYGRVRSVAIANDLATLFGTEARHRELERDQATIFRSGTRGTDGEGGAGLRAGVDVAKLEPLPTRGGYSDYGG